MSIVTHTREFTTQPNGSTHNVVRMYDQDGREYTVTFFAPVGFDVTAKIAATIAATEEQMAQAEFENIVEVG